MGDSARCMVSCLVMKQYFESIGQGLSQWYAGWQHAAGKSHSLASWRQLPCELPTSSHGLVSTSLGDCTALIEFGNWMRMIASVGDGALRRYGSGDLASEAWGHTAWFLDRGVRMFLQKMFLSWLICSRLSSIIAVHGLNGDSKKTWKHSKSNHFWLDSLPLDVKGARIMNYGYNADVVFGKSTADIGDHAKSLLGSLIDERETDDVRHHQFSKAALIQARRIVGWLC